MCVRACVCEGRGERESAAEEGLCPIGIVSPVDSTSRVRFVLSNRSGVTRVP